MAYFGKGKSVICSHNNNKEVHLFDAAPLYLCDDCRLLYVKKDWKNCTPKDLYKEYYRNEMAGKFNFGIEKLIRLFRFFRAFKIFTIDPGAKRILDIGSGRGFMLYYLKKYYKYQRTAGTQISKNALLFSRDKLGLEIYDRDLLELPMEEASFDIITMWHVLEHVREPEKYIEKIFNLLKSGGKLVIEVPNFNSWTRALTNKYWLGLDLDYHVTFFTPASLCKLLQKYNFKIKTVHTFSLEYSAFISAQSLVSFLTKSDHLFFKFLETGGFDKRLMIHIFLFAPFFPVSLLINMLLFFSKRGEVLLIVAEKE